MWTLLVTGATLAMTMAAPAGALSSGHPSLPGRLAALLRERFSDLELLGPANATEDIKVFLRSRRVRQSSPFACEGDFDGDGLQDTALLVRDKTTGTLKLMAFHQGRSGGYTAHLLEDLKGVRVGAGQAISDFIVCMTPSVFKQVEGGSVRVTHDSVSLESDGKGSALYYWDKGTYRGIPTSD